MPRKRRIHYPGAIYHVMLRGNAKQDIFHGDEEYRHFESILADGLEEYSLTLHAYCWMKNHVHMALQVKEAPLSKFMQTLSQRYTQWINKKHERVGHLFQGRYKAILVDKDDYLAELIRYIHLNPVRAGIVGDPTDYTFSSHAAYAGHVKAPSWLFIDRNHGQFGKTLSGARAEVYKVSRLEMTSASRARLLSEARAMTAMIGMDHCHYQLSDFAAYYNRGIPSLCRQVKVLRARLAKAKNNAMQEKMRLIKKQISAIRQA
jgi:REP element-mobilizing transposase RayT